MTRSAKYQGMKVDCEPSKSAIPKNNVMTLGGTEGLFRPMKCKEIAICKLKWNYLSLDEASFKQLSNF
jgi:hypothetical protein